MEASYAGSDLWIERYPDISFRISYQGFAPYKLIDSENGYSNASSTEGFSLYSDSISEEIDKWRQKLQIDEVEILYLYGIGLGYYYSALKNWLKEKKERMIIFLEDDLGVLAAFSQSLVAEEIIKDPQVYIQLIDNPKALNATLKELTETFPSHRVEVSALASYAKARPRLVKKIRLKVWKESAIVDALMTEALYSHQLVANVLANLKHWHGSFFANGLKNKFKNIPAVICGAGPSLSHSLPLLKTLEDRALIIAGGSTITALSNQGIIPHIGMALDPNPEEYSRLKETSAFEMPLLYGTRVQPQVFDTANGPLGYVHSFTGGPSEAFFEQELGIQADPIGPDLGPEAFSVTTLAIALAVEMGCNPIILNGIDLAYTGMERYAAGVMPSSAVSAEEMDKDKRAFERLLRRKNIHGEMVYTVVKWVMESSSISNYAKAHRQAQFINVTAAGLGFKGIPNLSFQQVIDTHCQNPYDLRAWLHTEMEQQKFTHLSPEIIQNKVEEIKESLLRLLTLSQEMLEELKSWYPPRPYPTGKMTILQIDFEEEKAFSCFLPHVGPAIDRLLNRTLPISSLLDEESSQHRLVERQRTKWEQLKKMIEKELAHFA